MAGRPTNTTDMIQAAARRAITSIELARYEKAVRDEMAAYRPAFLQTRAKQDCPPPGHGRLLQALYKFW